ncbi:hypothetical protein ABZZ79_35685 [Streptomyces sp. NPDC006458]|uniref:hypothetical protein n=1 Tax=Streptomyces sp. NPDC006458 TaxID=3154302 RepID=UPI0033B834FA
MSDRAERLRAARAAAQDERGRAAGRLAAARDALAAAPDADRRRLTEEHARALAALHTARADERQALDTLGSELARLVTDPLRRIGGLDARFPVALLPVRLETRFRRDRGSRSGRLLVRIYPDGLLAHGFEPLLTDAEATAGEAYWRRVRDDGMTEADAWTALVAEATPERAAWIVARTEPTQDGGTPVFPPREPRPPGWHRAPEAPLLPDRWIVSCLRGGSVVHRVIGKPVREGLAFTLRMSGDGEEESLDDSVALTPDGLSVEPALRWAYSFDEAVEAGMAVVVPLTTVDLATGFDQVLATGVRTTQDPLRQAEELAGLLDGLRFSRGWAFVPQGARTNNSADAPSDHPRADPAGAASFAVARGAPAAGPGTDGRRFTTALGLAPAIADHVAGAGRDEQTPARAMAAALWPATVGHFLDQMMTPDIGEATARALRAHADAHVRARGPLPAFRAGAVPYGLLPVSSLARWAPEPGAEKPLGEAMPGWLRLLLRGWRTAADTVPRLGRSTDPDADLTEVFGQHASAQGAQIRKVLGPDLHTNLFGFLGLDPGPWRALERTTAQALLDELGDDGPRRARALRLTFGDLAHDFAGPMVQREPLSETEPLVVNYLAWLRTASPEALRDQRATPTGRRPQPLLFLMLRHALLRAYDTAALDLLTWRGLAAVDERFEAELIDVVPGRRGPDPTAWTRFDQRLTGVTGDRTLGVFLADPRAGRQTGPAEVRRALAPLHRIREDLRALEQLPSAELERLFTETLDTCSHRLDPWITSLSTQRLARMRQAQPLGVHVGGYGWIEDLRPDPAPELVPVGVGASAEPARARTDSGGHVHAPSMAHAATAAVLRGARLARGGQEAYAVDLSSRRVRAALALIDGVRADQPLGAGLGHRFERGLHEGHPGVELDRFIDDLRALYPLVANKTQDSGEPAESVAARNVVDGLRLRAARRAGTIPWGSAGLTPNTAQRAAIEDELRKLDDAVDAVADLLLAESVHQTLRGSPAAAGATLDSLAKGHRPPEPDVVRTPRGGGVLHQRVALVLSATDLPPEWQALGATPRARAAPELDAWLGALLGPPARLGCVATAEGSAPRTVTAADLALAPVDWLLHAAALQAGAASAELDRRIAWEVTGASGPDTAVTVDHTDAGSAALSFAEALELLSEVARALGHARPLTPADLVAPEQEAALASADPMTAENDGRADTAETALDATAQRLGDALTDVRAAPEGTATGLTALRAALLEATALGVTDAFPPTRHDAAPAARDTLLTLADAAAAELDRRIAARSGATDAAQRLHAVFGRALPVLPPFRPAAPEALAPALATEPALGADPDGTVEGWLAGVLRVREPLDAWRQVIVYARTTGTALERPRIAQLPPQEDAVWAALTHPAGQPHRSGLTSLALFGNLPAVDAPWNGLLLDTWPEILPNHEEETGVAFHYDAPGTQAPHSVLLAVPPTTAGQWSYDDLEATLLETLELAHVRAVDLCDLGRYGQLLPAAYLAANVRNATVTTSFTGMLTGRPTILRED